MIHDPVFIPPRVLTGLRREAAAAAPAECCGALIGQLHGGSARIRTLLPVPNQAPDAHRYHIDAPTVLRLERQAVCAGLEVVGFYHSHPSAAPSPSSVDLELAFPGYLYIIVEPASGLVKAWRVRDDRCAFDELPLVSMEGAA